MYGENENNQDYNQTTEGESFESNEHTEQAKEQVQDSTDVSQTVVESTYRNVYYNDNADFGSEAKQSYINGAIYEEPQKQKKSGKGKKTAKFIAKAAAFGLIAGAAFFGINAAGKFIYPSSEPEKKTVQLAVTTTNSGGKSSGATMALDVSDVVEEVMPSVVSVVSRLSSEITYGPFSLGKQEYDNSGSGIIVGQSETELLIATNNHVIEDAQTITVTFTDRTPEDLSDDVSVQALLKGSRSENDLAVIAVPLKDIPEEVLSYIKIATLGDSDSLRIGEGTIAIGNALGYGQEIGRAHV